jgi:hypothetical protein
VVLVTPQKLRPAVPTLREAETAGNTSDVDVDQQMWIELAGDNGLPDVLLPNDPLPDDPLPDVPLPNVPLPNLPLSEALPDASIGAE